MLFSLESAIMTLWMGFVVLSSEMVIPDVTIPANTSATIYLTAAEGTKITESGRPLAEVKEVKLPRTQEGRAVIEVGSGTYYFATAPQ
jgi:alpha-L-rhamnosidase